MQLRTKAIVLSSFKYGDTSLIVRAYTESDGLKAYLLKGILASRKGKLKTAYFQPLSQLDIVAIHKNKGTLEQIREARIDFPYSTMHTDITKNAITMFLAEMLTSCIREEQSDPALFSYLQTALQWLDTHDQIANFHLYFLLSLTRFLGCYPDLSDIDATYFDLLEGQFTDTPRGKKVISGDELNQFRKLLGTNFDVVHLIQMSKKQRQQLLQMIVEYFELHLHGFRKPRSLAVLNEVFN
ncbi:DNA repair protein RecO [Flavobacteriaceae bacterium D16]|nr:DNA repair protein RecO [Flavobacteriaceae bacterium D16]